VSLVLLPPAVAVTLTDLQLLFREAGNDGGIIEAREASQIVGDGRRSAPPSKIGLPGHFQLDMHQFDEGRQIAGVAGWRQKSLDGFRSAVPPGCLEATADALINGGVGFRPLSHRMAPTDDGGHELPRFLGESHAGPQRGDLGGAAATLFQMPHPPLTLIGGELSQEELLQHAGGRTGDDLHTLLPLRRPSRPRQGCRRLGRGEPGRSRSSSR